MSKDFKSIIGDIGAYTAELRKLIPDTMNGFVAMSRAATQTEVLDEKTKELIALALGVSSHCDGCLGYHAKTLARLGTTREEIAEALGMAIYMGGGPALMYAADALRSFDQFAARQDCGCACHGQPGRVIAALRKRRTSGRRRRRSHGGFVSQHDFCVTAASLNLRRAKPSGSAHRPGERNRAEYDLLAELPHRG